MEEGKRALIISLKLNTTKLRETLEACEMVAGDNHDDWWCPLCEEPVEDINPCHLAIHAKEGAARARAALLLLQQAVNVANALERTAHSATLAKALSENP